MIKLTIKLTVFNNKVSSISKQHSISNFKSLYILPPIVKKNQSLFYIIARSAIIFHDHSTSPRRLDFMTDIKFHDQEYDRPHS